MDKKLEKVLQKLISNSHKYSDKYSVDIAKVEIHKIIEKHMLAGLGVNKEYIDQMSKGARKLNV